MTAQEHRSTHPDVAARDARKTVQDAEGWINECTGGEAAIALAVIAVAKASLALEARVAELLERLGKG